MRARSFAALPEHIRALPAVSTLERNWQQGRLAHAMLLKGEAIDDLESVALALANALLNCRDALAHPDCFTLRPAKKLRQITIGDRHREEPNTMRQLLRDLQKSSNQQGYKVAIVYEADRMNDATANAFLKTLEEPPRDTIILMLSTRPYDLLDTIRSRCFQFKINSTAVLELDGWPQWRSRFSKLIETLHLSPTKARREPHRTFLSVYALIEHFNVVLKEAAQSKWKSVKASLPESMTDDEREAAELGIHRELRDRMLVDVELALRAIAIHLSHAVPFPARQLAASTAALERIPGLLTLNMKEDSAMELFLLSLLPIWTQH